MERKKRAKSAPDPAHLLLKNRELQLELKQAQCVVDLLEDDVRAMAAEIERLTQLQMLDLAGGPHLIH